MCYGTALAISDILAQDNEGLELENVSIDCIDKSKTMIKLGKQSWKTLTRSVHNTEFQPLKKALDIISYREFSEKNAISYKPQISPSKNIWFSALHAVDNQNTHNATGTLIDQVNNIVSPDYSPDFSILTSFQGRKHLVQRITPALFADIRQYRQVDQPAMPAREIRLNNTSRLGNTIKENYPNLREREELGGFYAFPHSVSYTLYTKRGNR